MNRRQNVTLTSQGKDNLFQNSNMSQKLVQPSLSQKQNKFLEHFNTINNIDQIVNIVSKSSQKNDNQEAFYMSKLQSYTQSKISPIQKIIRSTDDEDEVKTLKNDFKTQIAEPAIHVKPDFKKNIQKINSFFDIAEVKISPQNKREQQNLFQTQVLEIGVYSQILKLVPYRKKQQPQQQAPQFYSIYNTPTQRFQSNQSAYKSTGENYPLHFNNPNSETERNIQLTPNKFASISLNQQTPSYPQNQLPIHSEPKVRKADMLLVQILRQKKRKGLVTDYYKIMELKLFEFLDFILQGESEFQGLSSIEKMKLVLQRIEEFKGKKVQGENKINLLKIFFEEFRNLKNQISQSQKKKPLQKVENKSKTFSVKEFSASDTKEKREPQKKPVQNWPKKQIIKETSSIASDKRQKPPINISNKVNKGMQDQWLGELQ